MPPPRPPRPPRLVDLRVDWLLQYAGETTLFDPGRYPDAGPRAAQVAGYLGATAAAVVSCRRRADDWAAQPDRWRSLADLLARVEAEFAGRILIGPADLARWRDDRDGLAWATLAVGPLDALIRDEADLARLPGLFARGVRGFGLVDGPASGLPEGWATWFGTLAALGREGGPTPIVDLAGLAPEALGEALAWFEGDAGRAARLPPIVAGGPFPEPEALSRLRAVGGVFGVPVGPPAVESPEALRAGIEASLASAPAGLGAADGLAVATGFGGLGATLPGLDEAEQVAAWFAATFDRPVAEALLRDNARRLLERAAGSGPE